MDLNILWFILIGVLFTGFFFLEGFDYGVGILLPFISKEDRDRRLIINSIGPVWDGNEVWMLTAGGAIFASFPHWYATMFSGYYMALVLMLLALISRATAFEFRSKDERAGWRSLWDWTIFFGSFVPALLWGVAFANLVRGVPIDASMTYTGGFFNLLNPYALIGGLASLSMFTLHGATFLSLKIGEQKVLDSIKGLAKPAWIVATLLLLAFGGWSFAIGGTGMGAMLIVSALLIGAAGFLLGSAPGKAFIASALGVVLFTVSFFVGLFPNVMISSTNPDFNLTIYNASSSPYTLKVMSIVAAIFVPIVLVYQGYTYWVFRKRLTHESELEY